MNKRNVNGKKAALLYMLEALIEAGKKGERVSQKQLKEQLKSVNVELSDNTIHDNLQLIKNFYPELTAAKKTKFGHETNWAIVQEAALDDSEWYFLMALVQSSRRITTRERNTLLEALHELAPSSLGLSRASISRDIVKNRDAKRTNNFFSNLMDIGEAIEKCMVISFDKGELNAAGELVSPQSGRHHHEVTPYRLINRHDSTFLLAIPKGEKKLRTFTVELLQNIKFVKDKNGNRMSGIPLRNIRGYENFDLNHYVDTHLFAFGDPISSITLKVRNKPDAFKALYFTFGDSVCLHSDNKEDDYVTVDVQANCKAMLYWAMLYADLVEVLKPQSLRNDILRALQVTTKTYKKRIKE